MECIAINLMYTPQTYLNGKLLRFPYKKAEALFYYIAVEKIVTRDQVAAMFWSDCDSEISKKNLRHALYALNKAFNIAVIKALPNHLLSISDEYMITCDLDDFYEKRDIGLYRGEIFHGFCIRNAGLFEDWLLKTRESVKSFFLTNYLEYMQAIPLDKLNVLENYFNRYIKEDPFDERVYRIMFQCYLDSGLYHKGIQLYQKLCTLLEEELCVEPTAETTALYYQLLNKWSASGEQNLKPGFSAALSSVQGWEGKGLVYRNQIKKLYDAYSDYMEGNGTAVLISGENGVGKTFLVNEFLDSSVSKNTMVLKIACYIKNKELILQPWNDVMLQLQKYITKKGISIPYTLAEAVNRLIPAFDITVSTPSNMCDKDYGYRASKNSILQILLLVARQTPFVILFENIHAMDVLSLDILTSLVHTARQEIFIICTSLDNVDRDTESFISATHNNWQLTRIHLSPMPFDEAEKLILARSASIEVTDEQVREIYKLSQGNLFFIQELVWNLENGLSLDEFSPYAQDMLNDQLNGLSYKARQLLDVISVFNVYVSFDELCFMQNENAVEISRQLEQLKGHHLIIEKNIDERVCFVFAHLRMRDFIYGKIHPDKKRRFHELAGIACENSVFNLEKEYNLVIRHYSLGGNSAKVLQYKIQKLPNKLFPDYKSFVDFAEEAKSGMSPHTYLQSLLDELKSIKTRQPDALEYERLEAVLLLAVSRCCMLGGEAEAGKSAYKILLEHQYIWECPEFFFKAYLQLMEYIVHSSRDRINTCLQALPAVLSGDRESARCLLDMAMWNTSEGKE